MKEKILVAEDNPQNMRLIEMVLRSKGYRLLKAEDGEAAVAIAARERPALIIMDMQLPRISGFAATRRIRAMPELGHTPIIGVTAYAMKGDREKTIKAGCDFYLSKPISTRGLPELIEKILSAKPK